MFRPRRHHHLYPVNIRSSEVFVKAPAKGSVSKMNQANLAEQTNEVGASMAIDLELVGNRDRSIMRPGDMYQFMRQASDRGRREIELSNEIDGKRDR
jgi:hypothetical protein